MPDESSSDQPSITDIYQNDPYRQRRVTNHSKITWQVPSISAPQSYLPYSDYTSQQQQEVLSAAPRTDSLASNGFHAEQEQTLSSQRQGTYKDVRQDSLLTTITSTGRTTSTLVTAHPFLHSTATTLSLSEELRKQKYQDTAFCCFWPSLLYPCGQHQRQRPSWRWLCFMGFIFLLSIGGLLLFICFPRLPLVSMAQTADTYGQELAEWGPPQNPFYRTTWQLNLTLDNHPNFIPLHITHMDLILRLHPSSLNATTSSSPSPPFTEILPGSVNTSSTTLSSNQSHTIPQRPPPPLSSSAAATAAATAATTTATSAPVTSASFDDARNTPRNENDTTVSFAWSTLPSMTLNTDGKNQVVNAIFHIDYVAPTSNLTDPTFAQLYKCGPHIITDPPH
ncbi:hypothetical protein BCR42DRAFT_493484 [Absidia repens]|uniref:Uncharacterized protein n=1 Tax=Absidia repens TaxID=90262 RepID=A0A1X2IAE6_9FUNG|nr:hypothetical protein BCR42DRAFT_493484 [Absidia repens]